MRGLVGVGRGGVWRFSDVHEKGSGGKSDPQISQIFTDLKREKGNGTTDGADYADGDERSRIAGHGSVPSTGYKPVVRGGASAEYETQLSNQRFANYRDRDSSELPERGRDERFGWETGTLPGRAWAAAFC